MKNNKNGFTLVELLAVIVILAIILVIAVPKVMSVIEDSKKATLESTVKMIASSAEKAIVQNTVLGKDELVTCDSVVKLNDVDYTSCNIKFVDNTAKVSIKGTGKFEGLYVCNGTKIDAVATNKSCPPAFEDDDWATIVAKVHSGNHSYEVGNTKTIEMDIDNNGEVEQYTIRVANITKCNELQTEPLSKTACGFVLEFTDIISEYNMNRDETNLDGWKVSAMRTYVNETIYGLLPSDLRKGIIKTTTISGHGNKTGEVNSSSEDYLYLLSPEEIYGISFSSNYDSANGTSRQLDYYGTYEGIGYTGVSTTNYDGAIKENSENGGWWLRSAVSDSNKAFFIIQDDGNWAGTYAHFSYGVSPAFRLAD